MARLVLWIGFLTLIASTFGSLPSNDRPQTGDDAALKRFLMKNNRLPYANETVETGTVRSNVKDWTTCEGCKLLVSELRNIIKNPQEVAHLKELLSRVCTLRILSKFQAECLNMVNNLIVVLHEIEPILDNPTLVCQELQYCPESVARTITPGKRLALLLGFKLIESMRPGKFNDLPCDECIFAVSELKSLIQSASIQADIKQELHRICRMAGQYESECSTLVDQYFDLLIAEVLQFLSNGRQVCTDIGLCKSRGNVESIPLVRVRPALARTGRIQLHRFHNTPAESKLDAFFATFKRMQTREGYNSGCLVCQVAFKELISFLSQERISTLVTTDMTNFVCGLIPETMKTGCTDFMKIYSRAFLQMIISEFTPSQICSNIGMCTPEDEEKIKRLSADEKSQAVCDACQVLSQYLSFEFQQPDFQQEIISTLKRACRIFPGDYATQCDNALVNYVPAALGFMADFLSRNVVCATLRVCPGQQATLTTVA